MRNIHQILRETEVNLIKDVLIKFKGGDALELGCGDGFQTKLLSPFFSKIISTDLNKSRMNFKLDNQKGIEIKVLDAEKVGEAFEENSFDVIFSSNLLEHLPNYDICLVGINKVLKKNGLAIIILPNSLWRLSTIIFHYPDKLRNLCNRVFLNKSSKFYNENNLKSFKKENKLLNILFPKAHGAYKNSLIELYEFSLIKWKKVFLNHGFKIIEIRKGTLSSGYRFGFSYIKKILLQLGFTTEYIYILRGKE